MALSIGTNSMRTKLTIWFMTAATLVVVVTIAIAVWVDRQDQAYARALSSSQAMLLDIQSVKRELVTMSDAMRGFLLAPTDQTERERKRAADDAYSKTMDELRGRVAFSPALAAVIDRIRKYDDTVVNPLEDSVVDTAKSDPGQAIALYESRYYPAYRQEMAMIEDLVTQIGTSQAAAEKQAAAARGAGIGYAIAAAIAVLAVALVLAFVLARAITSPLEQLVTALDMIRRGDFTRRLRLQRQDEFGKLADAFDRMNDDLTTLIGDVQRSSNQVNTSIVTIAATSKQQQATASEIAATTTEIGATSNEISATARELLRTMNEVAAVGEQTASLAGGGQAGLARMGELMAHVTDAAAAINARLVVLNEKAGRINQVVTTITKVADQTNLLSLNAAIEAEKAGEYGRGFSVVATEIRRLADQTAIATYEIDKMVKDILAAVSASVMGMDKFADEVRRGVDDIQEVGGQLGEIIHQVQALAPRFETVREGMQAQSTGADQISEALRQLSEAVQQTADSIRQSSTTIDELGSVFELMRGTVSRLRVQA